MVFKPWLFWMVEQAQGGEWPSPAPIAYVVTFLKLYNLCHSRDSGLVFKIFSNKHNLTPLTLSDLNYFTHEKDCLSYSNM